MTTDISQAFTKQVLLLASLEIMLVSLSDMYQAFLLALQPCLHRVHVTVKAPAKSLSHAKRRRQKHTIYIQGHEHTKLTRRACLHFAPLHSWQPCLQHLLRPCRLHTLSNLITMEGANKCSERSSCKLFGRLDIASYRYILHNS